MLYISTSEFFSITALNISKDAKACITTKTASWPIKFFLNISSNWIFTVWTYYNHWGFCKFNLCISIGAVWNRNDNGRILISSYWLAISLLIWNFLLNWISLFRYKSLFPCKSLLVLLSLLINFNWHYLGSIWNCWGNGIYMSFFRW